MLRFVVAAEERVLALAALGVGIGMGLDVAFIESEPLGGRIGRAFGVSLSLAELVD